MTGFAPRPALSISYLTANPVEHGGVVEVLDRQPIFHMPYDRMNGAWPGVSPLPMRFHPTPTQALLSSAKRIRAMGGVVDVVYNAMDRIREVDESIRRISGPFVGREVSLTTPTYFSDWGSMEQFSVEGLALYGNGNLPKDPYEGSTAEPSSPRRISSLPPTRSPIRQRSWSAEFSDPLCHGTSMIWSGERRDQGPFLEELRAGVKARGLAVTCIAQLLRMVRGDHVCARR